MKTSELIGPALDWAVAKCEGIPLVLAPFTGAKNFVMLGQNMKPTAYEYLPTSSWSQGGPIIEREKISNDHDHKKNRWVAIERHSINPIDGEDRVRRIGYGPTPLIAAMRCYVASKFGDEVKIPKELM